VIASAFRIARRAPLAIALLLGGLLTIALVFPRVSYARRDRIIARWSRWLLRACGIRLVEQPAPQAQSLASLQGPALIVANHISWIDIFLMLATTSDVFHALPTSPPFVKNVNAGKRCLSKPKTNHHP
jgi:1-acyl-sn-glycerol-3-phosphate acyltransferase